MNLAIALDRRAFLGRLAASSALLGPSLAWRPAWAADGTIYQRIWDADQSHRGIPALPAAERGDERVGYVRVAEVGEGNPEHRLFVEVHIPDEKRLTYDLCRQLFDNFRLDQTKRELTTAEEAQEILALLDAITDSAPMAEARRHLEAVRGKTYGREIWQELLFELWFRPFDHGRNLDLSGFEHVVVGEQKAGEVSGYHFWYKYYLDDWPILLESDDIDYAGTRYDGPRRGEGRLTSIGRQVPEVVTLAYRWDAHDFETGSKRPLFQRIGGFWVGCSVEGLLALGTVRFFQRGRVDAVINGARYEVDLFRSPDGKSVRTTFPRFLGLA